MSECLARAARDSQHQRAGHALNSVGAVLEHDILVIVLQGALTPAERAITRNAMGASQLQEFHRHLFASSSADLLLHIKEITGVEVLEVIIQIATTNDSETSTRGTMLQIFLLAAGLSAERWNSISSDA